MHAEALVADLRAARHLVVLTGAGMGLASGIPTFRGTDDGAIWARDVTELGTHRYFLEDPVGSWRWYLSRFDGLDRCEPNAGHRALAALERLKVGHGHDFLLITQNVDTLHRKAGSELLVEVHGRADRVRCDRDGCVHGAPRGWLERAKVDFAPFLEKPELARLPRCPACGALIRAHVLWFDEYYHSHVDYGFDRVKRAFREADLILCVGTSFSVGVTAAAEQCGAPMWAIDPSTQVPRGIRHLRAAQEEALPAVVAAL